VNAVMATILRDYTERPFRLEMTSQQSLLCPHKLYIVLSQSSKTRYRKINADMSELQVLAQHHEDRISKKLENT
jgi:hypothetical protein